MSKRLLIAATAIALIAAACGNDEDNGGDAADSGGAQKVTINVDAKTDSSANGFASGFTAYFPDAVTLHPGDSVDFVENWTGEPHTVTFGTLVEAGLAAADKVTDPNAPPPAELVKVPDVFPPAQGDAVQTSGQPCFIATGDLPLNGAACPKVTQPAFDGTQVFYNSGFLPEDAKFSMKLADDIAPGTYRYMCAIHRQGMQGKITVVGKDATAQTADQVEAAGSSASKAGIAKLKTVFNTVTSLPLDKAQAGGAAPDLPSGILAEFGPKTISIPVNGSVTWDVQGPHTVSFNAPEDAVGAITKGSDGVVHLNTKALAPAGGPGDGAPAPHTAPTVIDGDKWDGQGFRSSGSMLGFGPPGFLKFKLAFSKAGTYQYRCLFHPDMQGTVKVGS